MSRNYSSTAVDTTLTSGVSPANTTLAVASTTGFPAAPFVLAVNAGTASQELVLVTAVGGLSLTVTRGYDSTVAATHETGAKVSHSHGAIDFRESRAHEAATVAHGATGAVVGTTNVQTLTNKTLTAPAATGSLADFGGAWTVWTPTVTSETGTITTASGTGRYERRGKTITWSATLTVTTAGTGAGGLKFTLPVAARTNAVGGGVETALSGKQVAVLPVDTTISAVRYYDFTTVIANGANVIISGTYEVP